MFERLNIGYREDGPEGILSNFTKNTFKFEGIFFASMEGLLQGLKFEDPDKQMVVFGLFGIKAKRKGQKRNKAWKSQQTLWWRGTPIKRRSDEFNSLIRRAFLALSENDAFRTALLSTGDIELVHSMGDKKTEEQTVLTSNEFCTTLMELRGLIRLAKSKLQDFLNDVVTMDMHIKDTCKSQPDNYLLEDNCTIWLRAIREDQSKYHRLRTVEERYSNWPKFWKYANQDLSQYVAPEIKMLNELTLHLQYAIDHALYDAILHLINQVFNICYEGKNLPYPELWSP
jgi:predicted NAD-dependent protein-ADP-ribosyltransferase YbiA (DUF1768 family)